MFAKIKGFFIVVVSNQISKSNNNDNNNSSSNTHLGFTTVYIMTNLFACHVPTSTKAFWVMFHVLLFFPLKCPLSGHSSC